MTDPMTTTDTSPEALERLTKTASIRFGEIYLRNAETVTLADLRAIEQAMLPAIKHAIAAEKRAGPGCTICGRPAGDYHVDNCPAESMGARVEKRAGPADTAAFLAGAKAMQEAAVTVCGHFDAKSPYIGQAKHVATAIRAIDPAALTERPVASAVADGWNYDMSAAPSDESVIISTTGGWIGEAMLIWCGEVWSWCWAGTLQPLHHNHKPTAWRHLPAPPAKQDQTK